MITERQTYKGLTLDIIDNRWEQITHHEGQEDETLWHATDCECGGPSMVRMKEMVDEWEAEGELNHLPNAEHDTRQQQNNQKGQTP